MNSAGKDLIFAAFVPKNGCALESHPMGFHIDAENVVGGGGFREIDGFGDGIVDGSLEDSLDVKMGKRRDRVSRPEESPQFLLRIRTILHFPPQWIFHFNLNPPEKQSLVTDVVDGLDSAGRSRKNAQGTGGGDGRRGRVSLEEVLSVPQAALEVGEGATLFRQPSSRRSSILLR